MKNCNFFVIELFNTFLSCHFMELLRNMTIMLILLDTSLYSKLLIKSFCFIFALGDSQSDIRLVSTRVNHSALT